MKRFLKYTDQQKNFKNLSSFKWLTRMLVLSILLTLLLVLLDVFGIKFDGDSYVRIGSILITFILFSGKLFLDDKKFRSNQYDSLRSLSLRLDRVKKMASLYRNTKLPFYDLPIIQSASYYERLNNTIDGKTTQDIKDLIANIEDKSTIVNYMMREIRVAFNSYLQSNRINSSHVENGEMSPKLLNWFFENNKVFLFYHPRIIKIMDEKGEIGLLDSIHRTEALLGQRFNVE